MTSVLAPIDAQQILSALVADDPEGRAALDVLRPEVITHTRAAYDALYRQPHPLPADVLHALAAVTADWQGSGPLAAWHRTQGAQQALAAADPVTHDPALQALRDHADLLSISPALVTDADQEHLAAAGHDPSTAVLISQLVSFESHLQRLVAGLAALHGLEVPAEQELTDEQRSSFASKASTNSVYFRMHSLTPGFTRARSELDNAIFLPRDGLPKAERELAAAVTSKVNDCIYCASVHARKA